MSDSDLGHSTLPGSEAVRRGVSSLLAEAVVLAVLLDLAFCSLSTLVLDVLDVLKSGLDRFRKL